MESIGVVVLKINEIFVKIVVESRRDRTSKRACRYREGAVSSIIMSERDQLDQIKIYFIQLMDGSIG